MSTITKLIARLTYSPEYESFLEELDAAGYAIVPKEPTLEMRYAGNGVADYPIRAYHAMLAAGPKVSDIR